MASRRFNRAFIFLLSTVFAAYCSLWSIDMVAPLLQDFLPGALRAFLPGLAMLVLFVLLLVMLQKLSSQLAEAPETRPIPPLFEQPGGVAFGFITGFILSSFLLFLVLSTPWRTDVEKMVPMEGFEDKCVGYLVHFSAVVDMASLQKVSRSTRESALRGRLYTPPPTEEEKKEDEQKTNGKSPRTPVGSSAAPSTPQNSYPAPARLPSSSRPSSLNPSVTPGRRR